MPDIERYETLVLGSAEAGKYLAWTMAKAGRRTAVIERKLIGGSCPNFPRLPSKNIIYSAEISALLDRDAEFGIDTHPSPVNMRQVRDRARGRPHRSNSGLYRLLRSSRRIDRRRANGDACGNTVHFSS